jgi:hypothetical protein
MTSNAVRRRHHPDSLNCGQGEAQREFKSRSPALAFITECPTAPWGRWPCFGRDEASQTPDNERLWALGRAGGLATMRYEIPMRVAGATCLDLRYGREST